MSLNPGAPANPFCTRFHAPGALAFRFEARRGAGSAGGLYERFEASRWRGEIRGPHGTGKSTLLRAFEAELGAHGHRVRNVRLQAPAYAMPSGWDRYEETGGAPARPPILVLDGAERLARTAWWRVRWTIRRRGWGVLATAHESLGLPELYRSGVDPALAEALVEAVLNRSPELPRLVRPDEVLAELRATGGDFREALFRLYDLHEARWRQAVLNSGL
ncbi:MAG: ATP-binding protein [Planctomycetota bacterium]|nr:ATP-binding protein [Planctomycetota bacterium]